MSVNYGTIQETIHAQLSTAINQNASLLNRHQARCISCCKLS